MSSTAAILGLAGQNLAQGRAKDALRLLDQALIDHGNERALHALRAQALYALGDQRGAAGAMAALVILGPADAESLLALGLLLDPLHADHTAALCCKRARLARPGFSRPALAEALIRLRAKDFAEAFDLIKAGGIGTTTPERIRLETRIGDSLREAMAEHAGEMEMLAAWPGCANSPLVLQALAECALAKLNFDTAIRALKRLAQLRPDWPYLTGQQAFLDFRTGNWSDVLRLLGTAPNAGETAPGLSVLRALAQARNGDEVSARRQLIQMVDTVGIEENDYRCARLFLARADLASGDNEAADRISAELTADGAGAKAFIQAMSVMRQLDHPGYNRLAHKIGLHHAVTGYIAARGHGAFVYYPESYVIPDEGDGLSRAKPGRWIVKATEQAIPDDLHLTTNPAEYLAKGPGLVQRLVDRPLLVNGKTGCIRLFLILPSPEAGRALIFDNGIVHFAPEPYAGGQDENAMLRPARIITSPQRNRGHPGLDLAAADGEPWAGIWSLRAYLSEIGRHKGVRVAGQAWSAMVHLARDFVRLCDDQEIFALQRKAPCAWSYPPKVLQLDCILDEDFKAHFLGLGILAGAAMHTPAIASSERVDADINRRLDQALARLICAPDQQAALGFTALGVPGQASIEA